MRYSIIGATPQDVKAVGGTDIVEAKSVGVVFANLDEHAARRLEAMGFTTQQIGKVSVSVTPPVPVEGVPLYTPEQLSYAMGMEDIRSLATPLIYGEGFNIAVVGTGIRETHDKIKGHIVHSKNFTSSPMRDGFDHDTGVCSILRIVAPKSGILNFKVLDDSGYGTEEGVVLAIDECISLVDFGSKAAPSVINLSLGAPDDGNPNNVVRVACRQAIARGIWVVAAAGNEGPSRGTVFTPAVERYVIAVGSVSLEPFRISNFSSRGPTLEGLIKPDGVLFGENIIVASSKTDTANVAKSGTSFSTPFASGACVLYLEGERFIVGGGTPVGLPGTPARSQPLTPQAVLDVYLPQICVKPTGSLHGKDESYGYGLPYGQLLKEKLTARPGVASSIPSMMMLMLGMDMVTGIIKSVKGK